MKQSFLNSLSGLTEQDAVDKVVGQGLKFISVGHGHALIAARFPGQVILWLNKDGTVNHAAPGNPDEVEADQNTISQLKHPRQPIGFDGGGTIRFKPNQIILWMLEMGRAGKKFDLCDIASNGDFSNEDLVQLYQLIGYSISGISALSFVSSEEVEACDAIVSKLVKPTT